MILFVLLLTACSTAKVKGEDPQGEKEEVADSSPVPTIETKMPSPTPAPSLPGKVTFLTDDGVQISGTGFGKGKTAVILAHQGTPGADQKGWHDFAQVLAENGFTALAFDFRGRGESEGTFSFRTLERDLKAAVRFLVDQGHEEILCVGASMGGTACMRAALDGEKIKALAIVASGPVAGIGEDNLAIPIEDLASLDLPKLFLTADHDYPRVVQDTQEMYKTAAYPKELHILPGREHGTDLFQTAVGGDMAAILLRFLLKPWGSVFQDATLVAEMKGSVGPIYSLDWSPDSQWLASAGYEQVKVWNAATLLEHKTLEEPGSYVWGVSWSPDGRLLAAASQDGKVHLWQTDSFDSMGTLDSGWAFSIAWSPDNQSLAVGTKTGEVQIWNIETLEMVQQLDGVSPVISLAWHPGGAALAQGVLNGEIRIWQIPAGVLETTLVGNRNARSDTNGLMWLGNGGWLASAHQDQMVRVWGYEQNKTIEAISLVGHRGWVRSVSWSRNGQCLVSGGEDGRLRLWSVENEEILTSLSQGGLPIWAADWSPDGLYLAVGDGSYNTHNENGHIRIWEITGCHQE